MPTLTTTEEDTRIYECCVLLPYPLSQKEEQEVLKEVEDIFTEAKAKQIAKDAWGRRGLAYPIKGQNEGSFVVYYYEMDPANVKEVDEALRIAHGVLRHLLIKPPTKYEILNYSEEYEKWQKERVTETERKEVEKDAEIKRKVAEKAKRKVKKVEVEKKEKPVKEERPKIEEDKLTEEIEKLISDDELDI